MTNARLITALLLLVGGACWAFAGDEQRKAPPATPDKKAEAPAPLGKTVKLEFKLSNGEEEPTFPILCAIEKFAISRSVSEPNGAHGVEIAGNLTKVDDRRLLLSFEASVRHMNINDGVEAKFTGKGSAILEIGKAKTLTVLGESPLKVTATLED